MKSFIHTFKTFPWSIKAILVFTVLIWVCITTAQVIDLVRP